MTGVEILRGGRMKKGDTLPQLRVKLLNSEGNAFNLNSSEAKYSVEMTIRRSDDSDDITADSTNAGGPLEVTEGNDERGIVTYNWQDGDTSTSGTYLAEFVADDGSGEEITFPNEGRSTIYIQERL